MRNESSVKQHWNMRGRKSINGRGADHDFVPEITRTNYVGVASRAPRTVLHGHAIWSGSSQLTYGKAIYIYSAGNRDEIRCDQVPQLHCAQLLAGGCYDMSKWYCRSAVITLWSFNHKTVGTPYSIEIILKIDFLCIFYVLAFIFARNTGTRSSLFIIKQVKVVLRVSRYRRWLRSDHVDHFIMNMQTSDDGKTMKFHTFY